MIEHLLPAQNKIEWIFNITFSDKIKRGIQQAQRRQG